MTQATAFASACHVLGRTRGGAVLTSEPLDAVLAPVLGEAFAAMDPWAAYPYPAAALVRYLASGTREAPIFALATEGRAVGALGLRLEWLRGPYIQFLGLLPETQGRGIGGLAMAWVEREARRAGARNLWVAASDFNAGALRFYERHGFSRIADLDGLVRDERTEVLLRKRLTG